MRIEVDGGDDLRRRERDERTASDLRDERDEAERAEDDGDVGEPEGQPAQRRARLKQVLLHRLCALGPGACNLLHA